MLWNYDHTLDIIISNLNKDNYKCIQSSWYLSHAFFFLQVTMFFNIAFILDQDSFNICSWIFLAVFRNRWSFLQIEQITKFVDVRQFCLLQMKIKPEQNGKCNANAELLFFSSKDYCDLQAHAMVILHNL